jgi:PIN domain nuclease of toxin-antitoxin system
MKDDPTIECIRAIRRKITQEHDSDTLKLIKHYQKMEKKPPVNFLKKATTKAKSHEIKIIDLQICQKSFIDVVRSASQLSWTRDPFDRVITAQSAIDRNRLKTKETR